MKRAILGVMGLLTLLGCASTPPADHVPVQGIAASQYDEVYEAARQVLRDRGYTLDRQDYRFGVITTQPRRVGTLLEPWEGAGQSVGQAADATVDQLRRIIRVSLEPRSELPAEAYSLLVEVQIQRQVLPTRRVVNTGNRSRVFHALDSVPLEWQRRGIHGPYWEPVRRERAMEAELRSAILAATQQMPDATTATAH